MPQERYLRAHTFNRVPVLHPVLLYDDCEGSYNWVSTGDGTDWLVEYSNTCPYVGTNGLLLRTKATTPAIGDHVRTRKRLWLPPNHLGRLQLVVRSVIDTPSHYIMAALLWFDGVQLHTAEIRMDTNLRIIEYQNHLGVWTTIFTDAFTAVDPPWNHLDLYVDFLHHRFGYVTFNHHTLDMSQVPVLSATDPTHIHLELVLRLDTQTAVQAGCTFDQIILTSETL